jgi:hypothetical protein
VKKIISIMVALGLVLAMSVMATPVSAATCLDDAVDACAVVAVTPGVECTASATYNITFTPHTMLAAGDMIVVDFPAGSNVSGVSGVNINGAAAAGFSTVGWTQVRATASVALPAGVSVTLDIIGVTNPTVGAHTLSVWTVWDTCPCGAAFTILVGGSIDPTSAVWCPGHNITVDVIWGGSTNITSIDSGTYGVDFIVDFVNNTTTIVSSYMAGLTLGTCAVATLDIDFDPGCNVTLTVTVADNATVTLVPGWNLISLPIIPLSSAIADVLASVTTNVEAVWYYDGCTGEWGAYRANGDADFGLTTMEDGKAYWVCSNASGNINLLLCGYELPCPPAAPPCYCYCHCWNMVGFLSTTNMTLSAYIANLSPAGSDFGVLTYTGGGWQTVYDSTQMLPGLGYFMAFTADQACFAPPV